ncbi:hypothetical protein C8F04DRAFT_1123727 [Mycena alexandri]|uniref:F-box domain-containing protein n=1 Tax=Mycena alexandri TaxID=1745969 RepID=A0AAD6SHB9_9AGAR|nr:hypothetical protein C8F04DRAFT_1123727 [Mycena alexandri]
MAVAPTPTCRIGALPLDILFAIWCWLDGKTITRCCSVCRLWRETIATSTELQYSVELWADGLIPGDSDRLSPVEKMERLNERRRRWRDLDWTSRTVFPINQQPRAYELVGGVFAQQNTWPQSDFSAIHLPTTQTGGRVTVAENIGVESLDFAMDPSRDLVIFLHKYPDEIGNLDCRSLSSLRPHPQASVPRLAFDLRDDEFRRIFVQIAGDVVGLLFRTTGSLRLVLFNWCTGTALVDLAGPQFPHSVSDFSLISPQAYILAAVNDSQYYRGRPKGIGEIHIYSFEETQRNYPNHVATLQLPHPDPGRFLDRIIAHSGPFCAYPLPGPFSKSNDNRIMVISLAYDRSEYYSIYVHHRYLKKYLTNDGPPLTIPWDEWGPQNSRMLPGRHLFWLRYVHGECVVCPVDPAHPRRVELLDFGVTPTRPGFDDSPPMVTEANTISQVESVFKQDVITALPYRRCCRDLNDDHILYLVDQDRIIGVTEMVNKLIVYTF